MLHDQQLVPRELRGRPRILEVTGHSDLSPLVLLTVLLILPKQKRAVGVLFLQLELTFPLNVLAKNFEVESFFT